MKYTQEQLNRYVTAVRPGKRYNRTQCIGRIVSDHKLTWFDASVVVEQCIASGHIQQAGNLYSKASHL